jgi:MarR family transcriptional regulator, temperature-dependent positive regulator of motility
MREISRPATARKERKNNREEAGIGVYDEPGYLVRRAQQIAVSTFYSIIGNEVTPIQYAALRILREQPEIDQVTLGKLCALDTSTAATLAVRLEERGLVERFMRTSNKRHRLLRLTAAGAALVKRLAPLSSELRRRMLEPLAGDEQEAFLDLLRKFVRLNNEKSRAPLRLD